MTRLYNPVSIPGLLGSDIAVGSLLLLDSGGNVALGGASEGFYLPLSGGTMSGDINMAQNIVYGLADPEFPEDAVHKAYVDGLVSASGKHTISTDAPAGPVVGDVWVNPDEPPEATYLPLSGGTMTGPLEVPSIEVTDAPDGIKVIRGGNAYLQLRSGTVIASHDYRFIVNATQLRIQSSPVGTETWTTIGTWDGV